MVIYADSKMESPGSGAKDAQQSNKIFEFPVRPGFGCHGDPVELYSTYVELSLRGSVSLYRYRVEIELGDRGGSFISISQLIASLLHEHFAEYAHSIVSDNRSILISSHELPIGTDAYTVHRREDSSKPAVQIGDACRVRLKAIGVLNIPKIIEDRSPIASLPDREEIVQALNLIVGHHARSDSSIFCVGSNRYFETHSDHAPIGSGLEVARGLILSVGVMGAPPRLLVNIHTTHSVFYQGGPLSLLMLAYIKDYGRNWTQLELMLRQKKVAVRQGYSKLGVARLRRIAGFAAHGDGEGFEKRPIIANYAGGSAEVFFFANRPEHWGYTSVCDYFRSGNYLFYIHSQLSSKF